MRLQTKAQRIAARGSFLPHNVAASKITLKDDAAVVYLFTVAGKPYAKGFRGTAAKPEFYHSFKSDDQRAQYVRGWLESVRKSVQFKAERRAKESASVNTLKVGDILYTSWGYDQTNVDFFIVTRTTGKTRVYVREIASDYEATGHMSGRAWPAMPIRMVGKETMHISRGNSIAIDGHHASLETGRDHYTSSYA